jgi:hypothetical protein
MPVLEQFARSLSGSYTYDYHDGSAPSVVSESSGYQSVFREGTGRRPKPQQQDETQYFRRQREDSYPRGKGELYMNGVLRRSFKGQVPGGAGVLPQSSFAYPMFVHDSNLKDDASIKALAKMNQRDLDLGTAWMEREKVGRLLSGVAHTAVDALQAIRRKSGRDLLNALGLDHTNARGSGFVNAALAYWYGLLPLMYDVNGGVRALTRREPDRWRIIAKAKASKNDDKEFVVNQMAPWGVHCDRTSRQSCQARISATQVPLTREQDRLWALGLDAPLSTVYELTPYSFVLDWALPIGDWLQALNSLKYYNGWTCTYSEYLAEECIWKGETRTDGTTKTHAYIQGQGKHLSIRRTVTSIPLVGLPIRDPLSVRHTAQALSLLASKLAGSTGSVDPIIRY